MFATLSPQRPVKQIAEILCQIPRSQTYRQNPSASIKTRTFPSTPRGSKRWQREHMPSPELRALGSSKSSPECERLITSFLPTSCFIHSSIPVPKTTARIGTGSSEKRPHPSTRLYSAHNVRTRSSPNLILKSWRYLIVSPKPSRAAPRKTTCMLSISCVFLRFSARVQNPQMLLVTFLRNCVGLLLNHSKTWSLKTSSSCNSLLGPVSFTPDVFSTLSNNSARRDRMYWRVSPSGRYVPSVASRSESTYFCHTICQNRA